MRSAWRAAGGSLLLTLAMGWTGTAGAQVAVGQVDTFGDGTTQNWLINILGPGSPGGPPPAAALPTNALGGPGGPADQYLRLHSVGGTGIGPEPGSRLAVINYGGQWVGNYLAAGIGRIRFDANNFGDTDLALRLLFENPGLPPSPSPPTIEALSATPILLAAGSGWQTLTFPLFGPDGLVTLGGGDLTTLLSNTTAIRIFNLPAGAPLADNGPPIVATLGVDNVTALAAVPEPATVTLVGVGVLALAAWRRRRTR
jgi:hypothetical protein